MTGEMSTDSTNWLISFMAWQDSFARQTTLSRDHAPLLRLA